MCNQNGLIEKFNQESIDYCQMLTQQNYIQYTGLQYIQEYTTIIQQDATVHSQFYFTAVLLYMFRVLSTPITRRTLIVSTASGIGHTIRYKNI